MAQKFGIMPPPHL